MNPASMMTSRPVGKAMTTNCPDNERIKRGYFAYLKEARRYSEASLDAVAKALHHFEVYTRFRSFKQFHVQQAVAFKRHLSEQTSHATGEKLSKATTYATSMALRNFFHWLAGQPGYRSRLSYGDADYFNVSEKDSRIAKAQALERVPTLEQINHVLSVMPTNTDVERRNRAVLAFAILTGCRDNAIASLKMKHVDLAERRVHQDPRDVRTKFSKSIITAFFPVGDGPHQFVESWVRFLYAEMHFGPDDPLFPATRIGLGPSGLFESAGLDRKHWSNASPIRSVFRDAFTAAGLPYFNPHSVRKTLVQLGQRLCRTPEEFKAWSQNLGHEGVMTTFTSYGSISTTRQAELIRDLALPRDDTDRSLLEQIKKLANRT